MCKAILFATLLTYFALGDALLIPVHRRSVLDRRWQPQLELQRRDAVNGSMNVIDAQNAIYIGDITIGGTKFEVQLDTGSSDLWIQGMPAQSQEIGEQASLSYAIGMASGQLSSAAVSFAGYNVTNQIYLQVPSNETFSGGLFSTGAQGILGLGPSASSRIRTQVGNATGDALVDRIFQQDTSAPNFISFLLQRLGDSGNKVQGQFTVGEIVPGYENITSQPKVSVNILPSPETGDQHWTTVIDQIIGPDGAVISYTSDVPGTPSGKTVAVLDSGFTLPQMPRSVSDAIYGRVQGAQFNTANQWWTVPCGQLLNISFVIGGVNFPVHPLDTVSSDFNATDSNGKAACIGAFQPITSAFSVTNEFDMVLGDGFLRNAYTLLNYGDFVGNNTSTTAAPYAQLLPLTSVTAARADFVSSRLGGTDTTSSPEFALLPSSQEQHSPVPDSERVQQAESDIIRYLPAIIIGSVAIVLLAVGLCVWRCCCGGRRARAKAAKSGSAPFVTPRGPYRRIDEPTPPTMHLGMARMGPTYADQPPAYGTPYADPYQR